MATSRIFVKGLPPTFKEDEFKKHFSQSSAITDSKIFPNRRIGYVGYRTPEDAQKAVKYFNKSFIRMSRIGVELARPIPDGKGGADAAAAPTARRQTGPNLGGLEEKTLKRKRSEGEDEQQDPKLKEFLDVMKPKSKKKAWEDPDDLNVEPAQRKDQAPAVDVAAQASDDEYETVPKKARKTEKTKETSKAKEIPAAIDPPQPTILEQDQKDGNNEDASDEPSVNQLAVSDSDWARSRTSRLLGLLDDEEEDAQQQSHRDDSAASDVDSEPEKGATKLNDQDEVASALPTLPLVVGDNDPKDQPKSRETDAVRSSMRLFLRNLPYGTTEEDLEAEFEPYGNLEKVRYDYSRFFFPL